MNRINILDDKTINKIAAGEVVERPESVVKELVENAIDSGAKNISIEIKGGGIDYIRITDNGSGIKKDDIPLAFCRHATSKISSEADLMNITSLGFRGEALSSIAAVSSVEVMTKTSDSLYGYHYRIKGGVEMSLDETGCPSGTTVIVRNLFYNTPARRKFLKSPVTEGTHITHLVEKLILSHPEISFKYTISNRMLLSSTGNSDHAADIYSIFGRDIARRLVEISFTSENCSIFGYVAKPEAARGNRDYELFFVNGRCIKSRILSSAVEEAYKPFLMLHRFPFVVLYIDIPSELLDVNVHPSKTEVRFAQESEVFSVVCDAVTEGITRRELIPEVNVQIKEAVRDEEKKEIVPPPEPFETTRIEQYRETVKNIQVPSVSEPVQETLFKEGFLGEQNRIKHRIVGQVFDTYWIIEYDGKMYIIDQHAAHEKVLYERFSKQIAQNEVTSQLLSPPVIISLSPANEEVLTQNLERFRLSGFEIEHFGGREYALTAVPAELFRLTEKEYFLEMLDDMTSSPFPKDSAMINDRIATMACKAAVKGNMRLSVPEADALISELLSLDNPYNCPHGRPTIVSFTRSELDKMFKRIV
ncbi:MAG: DNA mismatch repair endonuclease MutL [Lachnospiraceae bacterium]|nr:DNA mismatch repair endonuclease MutL [Lachnospiraceae bacterium]